MADETRTDAAYSGSSVILMLAAALSMFLLVLIETSGLPAPQVSAISAALRQSVRLLLPYAIVVALAAAGFRGPAAGVAVIVGGIATFYGGVLALLSIEPVFIGFAALQVVMIGSALFAFREWTTTFFDGRPGRRLSGIAIGAALWLVATGAIATSHVTKRAHTRQRADSVAAAVRSAADLGAQYWMRRSNLERVISVARCLETHRDETGAYAPSLDALRAWVRRVPGGCNILRDSTSSDAEHTRIHYTPPRGRPDPWRARGYVLELESVWEPSAFRVPPNAPGTRSYLIDTAGMLHATAANRRATTGDAQLPICPRGLVPSRVECSPWLPRQRWGLTQKLPDASISFAEDSIRVGDTTLVNTSFMQMSPLDSLRAVQLDWGDGTRPVQRLVSAGESYPGIITPGFAFRHVYADTGRWGARVTMTTREGIVHEATDTIRAFRMLRVQAIGVDGQGRLVRGGVAAEAKQALENIRGDLERSGSSVGRVTHCDVRLRDTGDWRTILDALVVLIPRRQPSASAYPVDELPRGARVQFNCLARF